MSVGIVGDLHASRHLFGRGDRRLTDAVRHQPLPEEARYTIAVPVDMDSADIWCRADPGVEDATGDMMKNFRGGAPDVWKAPTER